MASKYQIHATKWKECVRCDLHHCRDRVVLTRGQIPCEVLFIGEAPGSSENVLGVPFIGPAGKLLDQLIESAQLDHRDVRIAFTNLVACVPKENGQKIGEPAKEWIQACAPRLIDFVSLCKPKAIIYVGKLAAKWAPDILFTEVTDGKGTLAKAERA